MTDDLVEKLRSVALFESLSQGELETLAASGQSIERGPGEEITAEGEGGIAFFLLLDGGAEVTIDGAPVRTLGPGDYVGEIALIDGGPRTATVTTTEPVRLFGLSAWTFRPLMQNDPALQEKILLGLCAIVRRSSGVSPILG